MNGNEFKAYAISKLGTPYFYGSKFQNGTLTESFMSTMHRMYPSTVTLTYMIKARAKKQVGKVNVDCSGLIAGFRGKNIGSSQLYSTAYTRLPISNIKDFAIGTVLWKSGHVGVYIGIENGIPMCIEAKGINYGTVKTKVSDTKWVYGLTFSDITYTYDTNLSSVATYKGVNPYTEPTVLIKKGSKGNQAKWVQWELKEAGFDLEIDGDFGRLSEKSLIEFQKSCKIEKDGICGIVTRKYLKAN